MITKDELVLLLVNKYDYKPEQAPETAVKLLQLPPSLQDAFHAWLETGEFPQEPVFSDLSPWHLRQLTQIKPPAIFLLLDWVRREPELAIRAVDRELIN